MSDDRPLQSRREHSDDESLSIGNGSAVVKGGNISIKVDANAISIIALLVSIAAIVIVLVQSIKDPQIVDAKIAAAAAEIRGGVQQQVAEASAVANTGRTNSRMALDKIEDVRVKLASKGIDLPPLDGH